MMMNREEASTPLEWKFSQVFGERNPDEELQDVDILSAIEFDKTGDYLAVGDRGGRVIIFETAGGKNTPNQRISRNELEQMDFISTRLPAYLHKTEFQSHEPEVKDQKVKKIKEMDPFPYVSSENTLLAERSFMSGHDPPSFPNGDHQEWIENRAKNISPSPDVCTKGKIANVGDTANARCQKVYAHAHDFRINSISNNSDSETFISADDLRINMWNLEICNQCFNIVDMKPSNMDDLTEVITSAEFHPVHCNMLAYSSSRGFIRLVDMRLSALCDHSARILQDAGSHESKTFFTEIIASISDIKFANDGRHLLSRDYMNLKLWDMHMDSTPVATFKIHEHLRPKLCELYTNDSIFDKFECCLSGDGHHFATGSYSNLLRIFSHGVGNAEAITVEAGKNKNRKPILQATPRARRSSLSNLTRGFYQQVHKNSSSGNSEFSCNLSSKLLHLAWHPTTNLIACASGNSLFFHHA